MPGIRNGALVGSVTKNERPSTVVTPMPCPWTLMFLFDQDTCPAEQLPPLMFSTCVSAEALMAVWRADVMLPEHMTLRTAPLNCAAAGVGTSANRARATKGRRIVDRRLHEENGAQSSIERRRRPGCRHDDERCVRDRPAVRPAVHPGVARASPFVIDRLSNARKQLAKSWPGPFAPYGLTPQF